MSGSQLAAALDIGSNSVHLLVARVDPTRAPEPVMDISHQAGIGRAVDASGMLGDELRELLLATVEGYVGEARGLGARRVLLLGTEALRQADDTDHLVGAIHARTGLSLRVLDRTAEGLLTLLGVTGGVVDASTAVADIGGGSTEVTVTHPGGPPVIGVLPTGSARLAASHIRHDPVSEAEVEALRQAARAHVMDLDLPHPARAIVSGGSGTNVSRLLGRIRTTPIDRAAIDEAYGLLRSQPVTALAARSGLTVRRVAQLAAGLAIGEALLEHLGLERAEVSDASLREGAIIAATAAGDSWLGALPTLVGGAPMVPTPDPAGLAPDQAS